MPTPITWPGGAEVTLTFSQPNSDVAQNVLHFWSTTSTPMNAVTIADLANEIGGTGISAPESYSWYDHLGTQLSNQIALTHIRVAAMDYTPWMIYDFSYDVAGGQSDNLLPAQISLVASLHTATPGRIGRGRIYTAGWTEENNTASGQASSTARTQVLEWVNALSGGRAFGDNELQLAVLSRKIPEMFNVTSVTCDARWDVQRRRANRRL